MELVVWVCLRKIEITATKDKASEIEEIFRKNDLLFTSSSIKVEQEPCLSYSALLPDQYVDLLIEELSNIIDLRLKENTIAIYAVEAQVSTHADRLKEKVIKSCPPPNPFERLVEGAEKYRKLNKDMLAMALFAAIVAIAGLFLDSAVLVIGAMLLSPLLGPITAFSVNTTIGRVKNLVRIQTSILVLLFSVVGLSALVTFVFSQFIDLPITTQIALRGQISPLDIVLDSL